MKGWCRTCQAERKVKGLRLTREEFSCWECGNPLVQGGRPPEREEAPPARQGRRKPISGASKAQRAKIAQHPFCVACGVARSEYVTIDPAHLVPRGQGGCDHADCVVGLCRTAGGRGCHRLFDDGRLDLLVILTDRLPAELAELQHMLEHVPPVTMVQRLANARMEWSDAA